MRVVLIVDPLESGRQVHSDGGEYLREAIGRTPGLSGYDLVIPDETGLAVLLDDLTPATTAALVFASNSLRHPDSGIAAVVRERQNNLTEYLAAGGGVLVLHQYAIDRRLLTFAADRLVFLEHGPGSVLPLSVDRVRSVLEAPHRLDEASRPPRVDGSQLSSIVSWLAIDELSLGGSEVVIRSNQGRALVAVSSASVSGRLAISAIPLDWHEWDDLLENLIRYVALGDPSVVVWQPANDPAALRVLGSGTAIEARKDLGVTDVSRMSPSPRLHIVGDSSQLSAKEAAMVKLAVSRGATVLSRELAAEESNTSEGPGTYTYKVEIGPASYRYEKLALSLFNGFNWEVELSRDPYVLRNIVVAHEYFSNQAWYGGVVSWPANKLDLVRTVPKSGKFANMTITSALAALQTHSLVHSGGAKAILELVDVVREATGGSDETWQGAAADLVQNSSAGEVSEGFVRKFNSWLRLASRVVQTSNMLETVRVCDWVYFLLSRQDEASMRQQFAGAIADLRMHLLDAIKNWSAGTGTVSRPEAANGALSHEARSNLLLAMSILYDGAGGDSFEVGKVIHENAQILDSAIEHDEFVETGTKLRVLHALAEAESACPSGGHGFHALGLAGDRDVDASLYAVREGDRLAAENQRLSKQVEGLRATVDKRRIGYLLGVSISTLVGAVIVVLPLIVVLIGFMESPIVEWLCALAVALSAGIMVVIHGVLSKYGLLPWKQGSIVNRWIESRREKFLA